MGDMGDDFRVWDKAKKEKKETNKSFSTDLILKQGFDRVEQKNGGAHIIITHNGKTADFWPSTGKYTIRFTNNYKRGVKRLIKDLRG